MSKQTSPTDNLFALLAHVDEPKEPKSKPKTQAKEKVPAASKNSTQPTPAARAEAKRQQEAEVRAKQKAEQDRKDAEAERLRKEKEQKEADQKAFDQLDSVGFNKQRSQRVKEYKRAAVETPDSGWGDGPKNKGKPRFTDSQKSGKDSDSSAQSTQKSGKDSDSSAQSTQKNSRPYNRDRPPRGDGQGKGDGGQGGRPPRREFDKHSATGRGTGAPKKGGYAGKGGWGEGVSSGLAAAESAVHAESHEVQNAAAEVEAWNDFDNAPVVGEAPPTTDINPEAETKPAETSEAGKEKEMEKEKEPEVFTYDDFLARQAEKKKQLEALVGNSPQARELSDTEKQSLAKFQVFENNKVPKVQPKPPTAPKTVAGPAPQAARKGQTPVALETLVKIQERPRDRDGPRGRGGSRNVPMSPTVPSENSAGNAAPSGENRGPPRQKNNFNNSPAGRGRDNRPRKGAPQPVGGRDQFPSLS